MTRITHFFCVAIFFLACGKDTRNTSVYPDASPAGSDAGPRLCTYTGMSVMTQQAERDESLGVLFYTATSGSAPKLERLTFDLYFSLGAKDGPQEVAFNGENLKDCHSCLMIRRNCESSRCKDGTAFLAQEGGASLTAVGKAGTTLQGTLNHIVFAEVTINPSELSTTVVPGGETWCIDSYAIDTAITAP